MRQRAMALAARLGALCAALSVALTGCGGSHAPSDQLVVLQPGNTWTYRFTGTVTLPDKSTQNVASGSAITFTVPNATAVNAHNDPVNILDRKVNLLLLDGRQITGVMRLYYTQSDLGIFVHGVNNSMGATANTANDIFVPATANPPYAFLYLKNPVSDAVNLSYANPFGPALTGAYTLNVGATRTPVTVPAGDFIAKGAAVTEGFSTFTLTNAALVPNVGFVLGVVSGTLPDGTSFTGVMELTSFQH